MHFNANADLNTKDPSHTHEDYLAIHEFFDKMQNPEGSCEGLEYVWSDMGCGGGFAAHFQLAASQWLRAGRYSLFIDIILSC